MYDLEILVPAEGYFTKRFEDFRKWGLLNVGDTKIKLVLSASNDNNKEMFDGEWPKNVDVEVVISPYKHVAQRIHYYYDSVIKPNTAKWYLRIDEDTINDIGGLMNNLNNLFDCERDYHLAGALNWDLHFIERDILNSLGYESWFKSNESPAHEHEVSITSNGAMQKILANDKAKKFFKIRKDIANGFGDQGLSVCARMEKVYPIQVKFLTIHPELARFSLFGGMYNHIHWTSRDKNACVLNWLESIDKSKNDLFEKQILIFHDKRENSRKFITLRPNNTVEEFFLHRQPPNLVGIWGVNRDDKLTIFLAGHLEKNYPLLVFDASSGSQNITYSSQNYEMKTGLLSEILDI
jgi:hypothetical protein